MPLNRIRDQRGLTLVELLITMALLSVGLAALLSLLNTTDQVQSKDYERGVALSDAQAGLGQMVRDLRAGFSPTGVTPATGNVIDLDVPANPDHPAGRVKYDCSQPSPSDPSNSARHACYRYFSTDQTTSPTTGGKAVIDHVANVLATQPVFTPTFSGSTATYFSIKLIVPTNGTRKNGYKYLATFSDGIYLRNAS